MWDTKKLHWCERSKDVVSHHQLAHTRVTTEFCHFSSKMYSSLVQAKSLLCAYHEGHCFLRAMVSPGLDGCLMNYDFRI